jgi:hypothetical protein
MFWDVVVILFAAGLVAGGFIISRNIERHL